MTALAANANSLKIKPRGLRSVIVTNAATIYVKGGVGLTTAGRASPWADTAGMEWLGVANPSSARNLTANAGGKVVGDTSYSPPHEVEVDCSGVVLREVPVAGATAQANVGDRVYCATDNLLTDLTLTPTTNVKAIGRIGRYHSATSFDVELFTPMEYANQALQGDITALTDSTGLSGSHDDTVAAITNTTALTDNGGGTADGTVQEQATFAASTPWNGSSVYPSAADEAAITAIALAMRNNLKEVTTELATQRTANGVLAQNLSDLTQKVNEILTALNLGN